MPVLFVLFDATDNESGRIVITKIVRNMFDDCDILLSAYIQSLKIIDIN